MIMKAYLLHTKLLITTLIFIASSSLFANDNSSGTPILTHDQYQKLTGCSVSDGLYNRAMKQIIASVVFKDEPVIDENELNGFKVITEDLHYTRRHTRDFFGPLMQLHKTGSVCAHESLVKLAKAAGFPEPSDLPISTKIFKENKKPYNLMTRKQYMDATTCLVSPNTYEKYRMAFFSYVLSYQHEDDEPSKLMSQFLQETGEGRRTGKNTLHPMCMTPTVKRIATELSLLNEKGEFLLN